MHPYIGIVCMYRPSDSISTRPDEQNTLTRKSADTNDAPQGPYSQPHYMESYPDTALLYATSTSTSTVPASSPPPPSPEALHRCVNSPSIFVSGIQCYHRHMNPQFRSGSLFRMDSTHLFLYSIRLTCFYFIIFNCFSI